MKGKCSKRSMRDDNKRNNLRLINSKKKIVQFFIVSFIILLSDLLLKKILFETINSNFSFDLHFRNFNLFSIKIITNTGGAFGLLSNATFFLSLVSFLVILLILLSLKKINEQNLHLEFSLIFAGTLGNLINRITLGYVIDYISILSIPYFNIADFCIVLGVILLIMKEIRKN